MSGWMVMTYIAKLLVSRPYSENRYTLRRMKELVERHLGEEALSKHKREQDALLDI